MVKMLLFVSLKNNIFEYLPANIINGLSHEGSDVRAWIALSQADQRTLVQTFDLFLSIQTDLHTLQEGQYILGILLLFMDDQNRAEAIQKLDHILRRFSATCGYSSL